MIAHKKDAVKAKNCISSTVSRAYSGVPAGEGAEHDRYSRK